MVLQGNSYESIGNVLSRMGESLRRLPDDRYAMQMQRIFSALVARYRDELDADLLQLADRTLAKQWPDVSDISLRDDWEHYFEERSYLATRHGRELSFAFCRFADDCASQPTMRVGAIYIAGVILPVRTYFLGRGFDPEIPYEDMPDNPELAQFVAALADAVESAIEP